MCWIILSKRQVTPVWNRYVPLDMLFEAISLCVRACVCVCVCSRYSCHLSRRVRLRAVWLGMKSCWKNLFLPTDTEQQSIVSCLFSLHLPLNYFQVCYVKQWRVCMLHKLCWSVSMQWVKDRMMLDCRCWTEGNFEARGKRDEEVRTLLHSSIV